MADNFFDKEDIVEDGNFFDEADLVSEELETPKMKEEPEESIISKIPSEVVGTTLGAVSGKIAEKTGEKLADSLEGSAQRMAARGIGLFDTVEGRKFLKEQSSKLGLPKGSISPESIGKIALEENMLGTLGLKSTADQFEQVDSSLLEAINKKQSLLDQVRGKKDLSEVTKRTQDIIGDIDVDLDPDAPKIQKAMEKELSKSFDEQGRFVPKYKTAKELESAKVKLQERQKYQATRADSASDKIEKAQARALRESVDELAKIEGLGEEFTDIKSEIGSKAVARDVLLGKSLKDLKSPNLDLSTTAGLAYGKPEIPVARTLLKRGISPLAKGMDLASKVLDNKVSRTILKGLPVIGAFAGYSAAKAEGLDEKEALARTVTEEATDLALGPMAFLYGGETGPSRNTIESKLEKGEPLTLEERKELARRSNEVLKNQMLDNPDKVDVKKIAEEYRTKLGDKASPLYNQLMSIANEPDTRRKKAKFHFMSTKPEYKKLTDMLEKEQAKELELSQNLMSLDSNIDLDEE